MMKAIFLDVDNTLLDFNEEARNSMKASLRELALPWDDRIFPVFQQINDELWHRIEQGQLTKEGLRQLRWTLIFRELSIPADGVAFEDRFLHYLAQSACPIAGAHELLEYLYPRYPLYVVSNAPYEQQLRRLTRSDMFRYLQDMFISERIGFSKPSRPFFDACFQALPHILPEEAMIIGDSLTADIQGGIAYGMKTCWYNPQNLPVPQDMPMDYIVHSLCEIQNIL